MTSVTSRCQGRRLYDARQYDFLEPSEEARPPRDVMGMFKMELQGMRARTENTSRGDTFIFMESNGTSSGVSAEKASNYK